MQMTIPIMTVKTNKQYIDAQIELIYIDSSDLGQLGLPPEQVMKFYEDQ